MIQKGTSKVDTVSAGSQTIKEVYHGDTLVYQHSQIPDYTVLPYLSSDMYAGASPSFPNGIRLKVPLSGFGEGSWKAENVKIECKFEVGENGGAIYGKWDNTSDTYATRHRDYNIAAYVGSGGNLRAAHTAWNFDKANNYGNFGKIQPNTPTIIVSTIEGISINGGEVQPFTSAEQNRNYPIQEDVIYLFTATPLMETPATKIYYMKVWNDNELVANLIPIKGSTPLTEGEFGFWDLIGEQAYTRYVGDDE